MLEVDMTLICFSLVLLLLGATATWTAIRKLKAWERQQMQEAKERIARDLIELDTSIAEWLVMLELPALAEETRRLEAARQLRTVLIGKLLRQRIPY